MRWTLLLLALLPLVAPAAQTLPPAARAVLGDWIIRDDDTSEAQAVIRFTEANGRVEGRIVRVLPTAAHPRPTFECVGCQGAYAGADLRDIRLVTGMRWDGEQFVDGRIVDPRHDRTYRAVMRLESRDRLRVRGYLGIRLLGHTQVWERAR